MAIIRHEIIVHNSHVYESVQAASQVRLTPENYSGDCTWYLEASAEAYSGTFSIVLEDSDENIHATLDFTEATPTVKRVEFSTPPTADYYFIANTGSGVAYTARVVCLQDTGSSCSGSETQIELGNHEETTSTVAVALGNPKYFTFNSANWNGTVKAYFEVSTYVRTGGTGTFYLEEDDGVWGNWTAKATLTRDAGTGLVRSSDIFSSLTDGRHYRITYKTSNSSYKTSIFLAKLIFVQTGAVTKLEETVSIIHRYDNGDTGLQGRYLAKYLSADWTGSTVVFRYSHDALNAGDSSRLYNVTDSAYITSAITGANQQVSSEITAPDSGDILGVYVVATPGQVCYSRLLAYVALSSSPVRSGGSGAIVAVSAAGRGRVGFQPLRIIFSAAKRRVAVEARNCNCTIEVTDRDCDVRILKQAVSLEVID